MSHILGVKFTDYGQVYFFSSGAFVVDEGQEVIVRTDQGMGLGSVVSVEEADDEAEEHTPIYRLANEEDQKARNENTALAKDAFQFCRKCIQQRKLEMKLVDVEVFFDRSKMIFYFTAPGRIDFRELIKDLVREYRTRIELRQIGVRHETQMLGALGNCGQLCCCRRFMRKFVPVTIKMAKEQNLFLNPTKISGICGRLLCCLSFEQEAYESFHRECPKTGKRYPTSLGMARVIRTNFFKKTLTLFLDDGSEREVELDEWRDIVNKPPVEKPEVKAKPRQERGRGRESGRPGGRRPSGRGRGSDARKPGKPDDRKGGRSDDRKGGRSDERKSSRGEDRKSSRSDDRKTGRNDDNKSIRNDDRKSGRSDERKKSRSEERRSSKDRERRSGKGGERRPGKDGERRPGKDDERRSGKDGGRRSGKDSERRSGKSRSDRERRSDRDRRSDRRSDRKSGNRGGDKREDSSREQRPGESRRPASKRDEAQGTPDEKKSGRSRRPRRRRRKPRQAKKAPKSE